MSRTTSLARPIAVLHRIGRTRLAIIAVVGAIALVNILPSSSGLLTPATDAAVDAWLDAEIGDAGYPGASIALVRDGHVEHVHVIGTADSAGRPVTTDTPFVIGSLSKSLTALAIMRLVDAGRVELDAPAATYLPGFRTADVGATPITIRELLRHTSGLSPAAADLSSPPTTLTGFVHDLADIAPIAAPGTTYAYANINYVVLGAVIEAVTGKPYPDAMQALVFEPLAMHHTTADLERARALGLGDAHRMWFGLALARVPLFRADLAPAGFIASTADDMAHPIEMLLADGAYDGHPFLSPASAAAMTTGAVQQPIGTGRYAMGWVDDTREGLRTISHDGSTTDMAALQAFAPASRTGIVVLADAQGIPYETFGKIDSIGIGALDQMLGRQPNGTLEHFYPVLDVVLLVLLAYWLRGLARQARRTWVREPVSRPWRVRRIGALAIRSYLDVIIPILLLVRVPGVFSAPWSAMVRTDIGVVILVFVVLRLADGGLRVAGWWRRGEFRAVGLQRWIVSR